MPLRWKRGHNPYRESFFQTLRVGPQVRPPQIVAQANSLRRQIEANPAGELASSGLTVQLVSEASTLLREEIRRAEELLLAHWPAAATPASPAPSGGAAQELEMIVSAPLPFTRRPSRGMCYGFAPVPSPTLIPFPQWPDLIQSPPGGRAEDDLGNTADR